MIDLDDLEDAINIRISAERNGFPGELPIMLDLIRIVRIYQRGLKEVHTHLEPMDGYSLVHGARAFAAEALAEAEKLLGGGEK